MLLVSVSLCLSLCSSPPSFTLCHPIYYWGNDYMLPFG